MTEEEAKVIASVWGGGKFIQFLAALAVLEDGKVNYEFILFFCAK